jgi:hypothetical protein
MLNAGYLFLISGVLFVAVITLTSLEEKRQQRLVLADLRSSLDQFIVKFAKSVRNKLHYLIRHIIKLSWYYSIHSMLRAVMGLLVKAYDSLEMVVINNRERARRLRAEGRVLMQDNHLAEIERHKASTALTASQKKKLRAKKLERD